MSSSDALPPNPGADSATLAFLRACADRLAVRDDVSVLLQGSLANGEADLYSDIDLIVVADESRQVSDVAEWCRHVVAGLGHVVAHFRATHIGLPSLLIFFVDCGGSVVKADLKMVSFDEFTIPANAVPVSLSRRFEREGRPRDASDGPPPDFADLREKFCGWIWYTHTKIARGELFEAVDSLNVMRQQALLPLVQHAAGIPREGYRRLERRLAPGQVAAIKATYPASFAPDELWRALIALAREFLAVQAAGADSLGNAEHAIVWILEAVERSRRAHV